MTPSLVHLFGGGEAFLRVADIDTCGTGCCWATSTAGRGLAYILYGVRVTRAGYPCTTGIYAEHSLSKQGPATSEAACGGPPVEVHAYHARPPGGRCAQQGPTQPQCLPQGCRQRRRRTHASCGERTPTPHGPVVARRQAGPAVPPWAELHAPHRRLTHGAVRPRVLMT